MAYKRVTEEEFRKWAAQNPGAVARINGQETQVPMPQAQDLGFFGNLARGVTKPLRAVAAMPEYLVQALSAANRGETGLKPGEFKSIFLTPEEEIKWARDPIKEGLKSSVGLGAYLVPGGGGGAGTAVGRIGTAAGRGAISGSMSGLAYSDDDQELRGALTGGALGGVLGGAFQGIGEGARAIQAKQQAAQEAAREGSQRIVDTMDVDQIAALPDRTKEGLLKQARSAGFTDTGVSDSQNIKNYLVHRKLAGKTPAETLENMTQEFHRATKLKKDGLKEIGGLSNEYIEQIKNQIDDAVQYSGLGATDTNAVQRMKDVLDIIPRDAKTLDKVAQDWYKMGLTRAGEQKMTQSGLYKEGASAIRDALKTANQGGSYTEGMSILSRILGLQDEGLVAKTASEAARAGFDMPLFAGAGFHGADIKTPFISDIINKTRAAQGAAMESGVGVGSNLLSGVAGIAEPVAGVAQRAIPGMVGTTQAVPQRQQQPQLEGLGGMLPQQAPQLNQMALIQAVLNGQISTTEANWLMEMLEPQEEESNTLEIAINELERLYGAGTDQSLSRGTKSTGIGGLVSGGVVRGKTLFNQDFADRKAAYDQQRAIAVGIINKAREAGVLNEGEYEVMVKNMPNEFTTEKVAQDWFKNVRRMLVNKGQSATESSESVVLKLLQGTL